LTGWHQVLDGKWSVQNGEIVGESGDGRYGWLVTDREYRNFILELKFKTEAPGNAGVQFRSHVVKEGPGREVDRMSLGGGYRARLASQAPGRIARRAAGGGVERLPHHYDWH